MLQMAHLVLHTSRQAQRELQVAQNMSPPVPQPLRRTPHERWQRHCLYPHSRTQWLQLELQAPHT